ncbi:bifunctional glycosyltransferase/CDP-glycerol:glycerophosphate glycerophosphotransferase [Fodinicurvata fenggangensis]|uniref:bifunctional glycosyltransferase/CDP-glycerol:glycerophosphate glycerophosphotransferase n=1 Tax=Fodinicurvata fenggangensis TaxID=1121830 RepID=UPI00047A1F77|nr:CDP-glycerol glycerophosphotransferase family protein [Fodinicurvata fenggangensis]
MNGPETTTNVDLSVIVPIYNTADYLEECIESILRQSLVSWELILVDDGSTDGSRKIAERYARAHDEITVLAQEHKRQGAARNLALRHARGRYVTFLDSDDTVPGDAYRQMVEAADRYDSDMVVGIQQSFNETRSWIGVPVHQHAFDQLIPATDISGMPALLEDISACNRLLRHNLITRNGLAFPEGSAGEDLDFVARAYLASRSITVLPEVIYNYRGRPESRTGQISAEFFRDRVAVAEALEAQFDAKEVSELYPWLLRSEVRKLVGNRFLRVIETAPYPEQIRIFETIARLVTRLSEPDLDALSEAGLRQQIRAIMLSEREYEALIAYENAPGSLRFLPLLKSPDTRARLLEPLLKARQQRIPNGTGAGKSWKLRKLPKRLLKSFGEWRTRLAGGDRKKANNTKYRLARPVAKLANAWRGRNIWLMDERLSKSAEDNAFFLFRYLRTQRPDIPVYYVLCRQSSHWSSVGPLGNVIPQYSWRHAYYLARSGVLVSTDTFHSLAYPDGARKRAEKKSVNVFLQHGVSGNKTLSYRKEAHRYFNFVVVSNERERVVFNKVYGFPNEQIKLTGLPRFDALPTVRPSRPSRKLLVAPTWRSWIQSEAQVRTSRYLHEWSELILSDTLEKLLETHDYQLWFRPHFRMMPYISAFEAKSSRIHILQDKNTPLHNLIHEADLLITDYSSVMYDFFYQEKPALAFMFDRLEWETQPQGPPLIDFDRDLAGEVVDCRERLLERLASYLENDCTMREEHKLRLEHLFAFRDHQNCERVFNEIVSDLEKRSMERRWGK